jgi:hypothetical protein
MTSRHAFDDTRWGAGPIVEPADIKNNAGPSTPIPESSELPPFLDEALRSLVAPTGHVVSFTVLPEPESVTKARHFALCRLDDWGMAPLGDDVGLVVSELVTNALRHSGGAGHDGPGYSGTGYRAGYDAYSAPLAPLRSTPSAIRLRLLNRAPWMLCGIMDASPETPRRKEPDYIAETGRGLHLVESFSKRWGWRALPVGKVVWALFCRP